MIGANLAAAQAVLADLAALRPCAGTGSDIEALCAAVTQTVGAQAFPGALAPLVDGAGAMQIDVAASTMSDWRRLKPVLLAFAGPTLTAFDGVPEHFDSTDPVGARLMLTMPAVTAIMRLPGDNRSRIAALRAVLLARDTLARAPELQRSAPVPTSWLLARFQDYLNVGRRDAAMLVLERLRGELRLDALNVKFLEVQLLATFEDWRAITALPEFGSLCAARRTPAITAILLEALYQTHVAGPFKANDQKATRAAFTVSVQPFVQAMRIATVPELLRAGLRIAIYSLTESSSRQAKAALEEISPSVTVDINADHGGSTRLRALAENSDLFVMAWLSAKHAASDFIRDHRGAKPLLYSRGKGFSSML